LKSTGIFEEENARASFDLRSIYPKGVPLQPALKAIKNANNNNEFLEVCALKTLAMVPMIEIEQTLLEKLNEVEQRSFDSENYFHLQFLLLQSLGFIGSKLGISKYNKFAILMDNFEEGEAPLAESDLLTFIEEFKAWREKLSMS
jgi:hypothetical protein